MSVNPFGQLLAFTRTGYVRPEKKPRAPRGHHEACALALLADQGPTPTRALADALGLTLNETWNRLETARQSGRIVYQRPNWQLPGTGVPCAGHGNPWGLLPGEARTLEAIILHGTAKAAAEAMGIGQKTVESQTARVRAKMAQSTTLQAALAYARWQQGQSKGDGK